MIVGDLLKAAAQRLADCGIDSPHREARLLLAEITGQSASSLMAWPERNVEAADGDRFSQLVARRCDREPLSRIIGRREFWSLTFIVTPDTLDPRPDTETLIEAALKHLDRSRPLRIADLGTGTGCILLSLLCEFQASIGIGVDISDKAVAVAAQNAIALGLSGRSKFLVGDWVDGLTGKFDLIISNPPYIPTQTIASLDPEVRAYDPIGALDGGVDGLALYRVLARRIREFLVPGGLVILEIGLGQDRDVAAFFIESGFDFMESRADLSGIPRALVLRAPL